MRTMLANAVWDLIRPRIRPTALHRCGAEPGTPDRAFWEARPHIARTGCPWRDLPARFGARDAAYNRFRRRVAGGRLRRLSEGLTEHPGLGAIPRLLVDSTIVRAHAHAAGAPRKKSASGPTPPPDSRASAAAGAAAPPKSRAR